MNQFLWLVLTQKGGKIQHSKSRTSMVYNFPTTATKKQADFSRGSIMTFDRYVSGLIFFSGETSLVQCSLPGKRTKGIRWQKLSCRKECIFIGFKAEEQLMNMELAMFLSVSTPGKSQQQVDVPTSAISMAIDREDFSATPTTTEVNKLKKSWLFNLVPILEKWPT